MFFNNIAALTIVALAASTFAAPTPQSTPPQPQPFGIIQSQCSPTNDGANLSFLTPGGNIGFFLQLDNVLASTTTDEPVSRIQLLNPLPVDCTFLNDQGEVAATLTAGVSTLLIQFPQPLPSGRCGLCTEIQDDAGS
jgi:hypothetical protein